MSSKVFNCFDWSFFITKHKRIIKWSRKIYNRNHDLLMLNSLNFFKHFPSINWEVLFSVVFNFFFWYMSFVCMWEKRTFFLLKFSSTRPTNQTISSYTHHISHDNVQIFRFILFINFCYSWWWWKFSFFYIQEKSNENEKKEGKGKKSLWLHIFFHFLFFLYEMRYVIICYCFMFSQECLISMTSHPSWITFFCYHQNKDNLIHFSIFVSTRHHINILFNIKTLAKKVREETEHNKM